MATSTVGGFSPLLATLMVDNVGLISPGILYVVYGFVSLFGLHCVATNINRGNTDDRNPSPLSSDSQLDNLIVA